MLHEPMDVLKQFPVRKSKRQKQEFRDCVVSYAQELGYNCTVEKGSMGSRNVILGDPEKAKYLVTAHYDTPARMLVPNLITPTNPVTFILYQFLVVALFVLITFVVGFITAWLTKSEALTMLVGYTVYFGMLFMMMIGPANPTNANDNTSGVVTVLETARTMPELHRDKVCFVLFDLEEAGLIGSSSYYKKHKAAAKTQMVLNLDCVGDGDHILFFPSKKLRKDEKAIASLKFLGGWFGQKEIDIRDKGFFVYPSDQKHFPLGIGIAAFHKRKGVGHYCSRIHTAKDTLLDPTNVNLLRSALTTLITGDK